MTSRGLTESYNGESESSRYVDNDTSRYEDALDESGAIPILVQWKVEFYCLCRYSLNSSTYRKVWRRNVDFRSSHERKVGVQ